MKKWWVLLTLLVTVEASAREKIGLVLGGGGARGVAHIGVLKVIEELNIPIDYIAGTSMGSIVGALYASGYSPDEIETIVAEIDWAHALTDATERENTSMQRKLDEAFLPSSLEVGVGKAGIKTPQGLIQGQHLNLVLRKLLNREKQIKHFDELPIPFRAIACDIVTGEKVVLESGDLVSAVRASMSVPGVFQPIQIEDHLLIDGGVVDNVPVSVVKGMGADRLIVVDVGSPLYGIEELTNPLAVTEQVFTVMIQKVTASSVAQMATTDVLIRPELGSINSKQFVESLATIPLGENAAKEQLALLKTFSHESGQDWKRTVHRQKPQANQSWLISQVEIDERAVDNADRLHQAFDDLAGQVVGINTIEARISDIYGEGRHQSLTYHLLPEGDESARLVLIPQDKQWGPHFARMGLKISDDFEVDSNYQIDVLARFRSEKDPLDEWRVKLGLGGVTELGLSHLNRFGSFHDWFVEPFIQYRGLTQRGFALNEGTEVARYRWNTSELGVRLGKNISHRLRTYAGLGYAHHELELKIGQPSLDIIPNEKVAYLSAGLIYDSLNDAVFPSKGGYFNWESRYHSGDLGADFEGFNHRIHWQKAFAMGRQTILTSIKASTGDDEQALAAATFLGGLGNLSGMTERQLIGRHTFFSRLMLTRRLSSDRQLLKMPLHVGMSLEAGNAWQFKSQAKLDDLIYAGSLFMGLDTPMGPLFLGYGRTDRHEDAFYLRFGSLLFD